MTKKLSGELSNWSTGMTWNFGKGIGKYRSFSSVQSKTPLVRIVDEMPRSLIVERWLMRTNDRQELRNRLAQTLRLLRNVTDDLTRERLTQLAEDIEKELQLRPRPQV